MSEKPRSPVARAVEATLIGVVESAARAGAKALESLAGDAARALRKQAEKADLARMITAMWRDANVPDEKSGEGKKS